MKKLLGLLMSTLLITAALSSSATAAVRYWEVQMYDPSGSVTNNTFDIEFKVFSTVADDQFEVSLFKNNENIASKSITHANGNSGVFTVTVPGPGSYQFHVAATNSGDGETKTTADKTVVVSSGPNPTITTQTIVTPAAATNNQATATPTGTGGVPQVAGAATNNTTNGQVNAGGQSTTKDTGDVLGASANKDKNNKPNSLNKWLWWLLAAVAVVIGGAYYYAKRSGKNPLQILKSKRAK